MPTIALQGLLAILSIDKRYPDIILESNIHTLWGHIVPATYLKTQLNTYIMGAYFSYRIFSYKPNLHSALLMNFSFLQALSLNCISTLTN